MRPPQAIPPRPQLRWGRTGCLALLGAGAAFLVLVLALTGFRTVDSGQVGVTRQFGKITGTRQAGGFFVNPVGFSMVTYDTRVVGDLTEQRAALKNQQTLLVNRVTYQYNLTSKAPELLLANVGTQDRFETIVVIPKLQDAVKKVTPQYVAEQVFPLRQEMAARIEQSLAADLARFEVDPASVDITLADIAFTEDFQASVNAKAKAEQEKQVELANLDKQKTQNERELLQSRTDAEKVRQAAVGQASADRERARGQADALGLQAEAEAKANKQVAASLDPQLINYRYAQNWNGQLPSTVLGGGSGANALIGLPGATAPQPTPTPAPSTGGAQGRTP